MRQCCSVNSAISRRKKGHKNIPYTRKKMSQPRNRCRVYKKFQEKMLTTLALRWMQSAPVLWQCDGGDTKDEQIAIATAQAVNRGGVC